MGWGWGVGYRQCWPSRFLLAVFFFLRPSFWKKSNFGQEKKLACQQEMLAVFFFKNKKNNKNTLKKSKKTKLFQRKLANRIIWLTKKFCWQFFFFKTKKKLVFFFVGGPKYWPFFCWPILAVFFFGPTLAIA